MQRTVTRRPFGRQAPAADVGVGRQHNPGSRLIGLTGATRKEKL